jgi:hypothetical protein
MAERMLNKFEKQERALQLHKEGKTIREISKAVHMAFRDISKIIKAYDKKSRLESIIENDEINNNQHIKKLSTSTRVFKLFLKNKRPVEVAIELDIGYQEVDKYWSQFLKLEKKYEAYEFYDIFQYEMPQLLAIGGFIRGNNIDTANISNILKYASNISNLQLYHNELQNERAEWEREKKLYIAIQNNMNYQLAPIRPMPKKPCIAIQNNMNYQLAPIRPMPSHRYNRHY